MSTFEDKISEIRSDIGDDVVLYEACAQIISHVFMSESASSHMRIGELISASNGSNRETALKAIYYLASNRVSVLFQHFEAYNPYNSRYEEISEDFVATALRQSDFADPFTGCEISKDDFLDKIIPFFTANEKITRL